MTFVDSNVFLYAIDTNVSAKQKKARGIVADAFAVHAPYCISAQVLAEFSSVAIRKLGIKTPLLLSLLSEMGKISRLVIDNALVSRAVTAGGMWDGFLRRGDESGFWQGRAGEALPTAGQLHAGLPEVHRTSQEAD